MYFFSDSDREYPRLGQMIVDYENPLKKMMEEFVPHSKVSQDQIFLFMKFHSVLFLCGFIFFIFNCPIVFSYNLKVTLLCIFLPPMKSLSDALISLQMVYPRRNLSAEQWRNAQLLSLISAPSTMLNPAQSDTVKLISTFIFYWFYNVNNYETMHFLQLIRCRVNTSLWTQWRNGLFVSIKCTCLLMTTTIWNWIIG